MPRPISRPVSVKKNFSSNQQVEFCQKICRDKSASRVLSKKYVSRPISKSGSVKTICLDQSKGSDKNITGPIKKQSSFNNKMFDQLAGRVLSKQYISTNQEVGFCQNNMTRPITSSFSVKKKCISANQQVGFCKKK